MPNHLINSDALKRAGYSSRWTSENESITRMQPLTPHKPALSATRTLILVGSLLVLAWTISGYLIYENINGWAERGQFGDMFGAINALFSGLALAGVVVAVLLQQREIQATAAAQVGASAGLLAEAKIQSQLLNAQLLRDRYASYRQVCEPATDAHVTELKLYPDDYMSVEVYRERYSGSDDSIRRYIYMAKIYEYLAFTHIAPSLDLPDPVGYNWVMQWTRDLCRSIEFMDVHTHYKSYYEQYGTLVDRILIDTEA